MNDILKFSFKIWEREINMDSKNKETRDFLKILIVTILGVILILGTPIYLLLN